MNQTHEVPTLENPFATRRIRPGAIPYVFPPGASAAGLVERLRKTGWWGEIVGPHGSGKSALLATLLPALRQAGRPALLVELHDGQRRLPIDLRRAPRLDSTTIVAVDGYEQLSRFSRFRLKWFCRRRGMGLLVTSHAPTGLPELFHTTVSVQQAWDIVRLLLGPHGATAGLSSSAQGPLVSLDDVAARFSCHQGNLREVLLDLYDLYQQRWQGPPGAGMASPAQPG